MPNGRKWHDASVQLPLGLIRKLGSSGKSLFVFLADCVLPRAKINRLRAGVRPTLGTLPTPPDIGACAPANVPGRGRALGARRYGLRGLTAHPGPAEAWQKPRVDGGANRVSPIEQRGSGRRPPFKKIIGSFILPELR